MFEGNSLLALVSRLRGAFYHRGDTTMTISGQRVGFVSKGVNYTVLPSDYAIGVFCTSANLTMTLPAIADSLGQVYAFVKTDSTAYTGIIDANGSETIDDATTFTLFGQWDAVVIVGGTSAWRVIARGGSGESAPYVAKTGTYTLVATDGTVNCTANTFTVTLPTAVGATGRIYNIKNSGSGTITLATTSSQTIDGATTVNLAQYDKRVVQSDGANWIVL